MGEIHNDSIGYITSGDATSHMTRERVFLSYARADDDPDYDDTGKSFMRRLCNALVEAGFAVWWDRMSLPSRGLAFTEEIENAIRACDRFVLIVGEGAIASDYVRAEWTFALTDCKPITPILRNGDHTLIPPEINEINAIDCRPEREESTAIEDLKKCLQDAVMLGNLVGVRDLPKGYIVREAPFYAARDALCADAINPTVISAPPSAIAVYGLGGIGKSTLATALARDCEIRRYFPDGILWIEVGQTPIIASLQARIGVNFGDSYDHYRDEQEGALSLSRLLRDKAALIVLDDVWDHKLVERFPISGTRCRLLITTRKATLAGQVNGADIRLERLTEDEGALLLSRLADGSADDANYKLITSRLGGHTLAVTLAGRQLMNKYADDAADLLRLIDKRKSDPDPFRDLVIEETDKDLNLALSLSMSYDALPNDDIRRRFRLTGIFPLESTFTRDMLAAVWGDADTDDARTPIGILVGAGLLDHAPETGTYTQHRILHIYARALMRRTGKTDATFTRYADWVIEAAKQFGELPFEDWIQLDPLLPHVDEVGDTLTQRFAATPIPDEKLTRQVGSFAWAVTRYVGYRPQMIQTENRQVQRGLDWLHAGLTVYQAQEEWSRKATTLNNIGMVYSTLGENRQALDYYHQALSLRRDVGDKSGEAITLNNIGMVYSTLGENRQALDYLEQALPIMRDVDDKRGEAITLNNIGMAHLNLGENRCALDYYQQALPIMRDVGDKHSEATTRNNIGMVYCALGENRQALGYLEQALSLLSYVGDKRSEAVTCYNIVTIYYSQGDLDTAIHYLEAAIQLFEYVEHPHLETAQRNLAQLKRERDGSTLSKEEQSPKPYDS